MQSTATQKSSTIQVNPQREGISPLDIDPFTERLADPGNAVVIDHVAPKPGPRGPSIIKVEATPSNPQLAAEVTDRPIEMVAGEYLDLKMTPAYPGTTVEIARQPPGSKASINPNRRLLNVTPGLYVVAVTLPGGWRREIDVACFAPEVLERLEYPITMGLQRRKRLRSMLRDPSVTRETIVAALEAEGPANLSVLLGLKKNQAVNLKSYN